MHNLPIQVQLPSPRAAASQVFFESRGGAELLESDVENLSPALGPVFDLPVNGSGRMVRSPQPGFAGDASAVGGNLQFSSFQANLHPCEAFAPNYFALSFPLFGLREDVAPAGAVVLVLLEGLDEAEAHGRRQFSTRSVT